MQTDYKINGTQECCKSDTDRDYVQKSKFMSQPLPPQNLAILEKYLNDIEHIVDNVLTKLCDLDIVGNRISRDIVDAPEPSTSKLVDASVLDYIGRIEKILSKLTTLDIMSEELIIKFNRLF